MTSNQQLALFDGAMFVVAALWVLWMWWDTRRQCRGYTKLAELAGQEIEADLSGGDISRFLR